MKKLIITDLDGTLLNKEKQVSPENMKMIREAEKQGVYFTISTGRMLCQAKQFADMIDVKTVFSSCNGALVADRDLNIYSEVKYEMDKFKEVTEFLDSYNCGYYYYSKKGMYTPTMDKVPRVFLRSNQKAKPIYKVNVMEVPRGYTPTEDIYKIILIDYDEQVIEKMREKLSAIDDISYSSSWKYNIEIMNKKTTDKGYSVKFIGDYLGVDRENIMCIGDEGNDEAMFKYAGFPVAMDNASDDLKARAKYITKDFEDDGVAHAIKIFLER